jgi:hypothetical protein
MNHHHDLVAAFLPMTVPSPLALPDSWIARSVMQKAIRRAETELAGRAAVTLLRMDHTATWQRLLCGFRHVPATHSDLIPATDSDRVPATHSDPVPATYSDRDPATLLVEVPVSDQG